MTFDVLPLEEQYRLVVLAQSGNQDALDRLVRAMHGLVSKIAYGFIHQSAGFEADDLIQEGLLATCTAIRYFRPERGYHLTTYVADCVRRRMWKYLQEEAAKPLPQGDWPRSARVYDHETDPEAAEPETRDELGDAPTLVEAVMACLSPLQRHILDLRYGLTELGEHEIRRLSRRLGLRPNRIEAIYAKALAEARRNAESLKKDT